MTDPFRWRIEGESPQPTMRTLGMTATKSARLAGVGLALTAALGLCGCGSAPRDDYYAARSLRVPASTPGAPLAGDPLHTPWDGRLTLEPTWRDAEHAARAE